MLTVEMVQAAWFPILLLWVATTLLLLIDLEWLPIPFTLGKALFVLLMGGAVVTAMFNWFGIGTLE